MQGGLLVAVGFLWIAPMLQEEHKEGIQSHQGRKMQRRLVAVLVALKWLRRLHVVEQRLARPVISAVQVDSFLLVALQDSNTQLLRGCST